ncbi:MAG: DNA polymerase III subunit delta [Candidatus Omnitrophica bacterium]|nr:DNA polymerase III subunit delta [Candidatus Omnitrophota bacterium]
MVILRDPSVYLLSGSEQFLKEEALARIKSTFLDEKSGEFNFNFFYAGATSAERILECATTSPFLGRKRIVLVRQTEEFSASDRKPILSYVKAPYKSTCLILETSEANLNQSFFAEIYRYARVISCNPLKDKQVLSWIEAQVAACGKKIEPKARQLLVENLGNNLDLLSNSLKNLTLYIGNRAKIEVGDVEKLVGPDLAAGVFELFDAAIAGEKTQVFQILERLLKDGVNSSQILGALTHQVVSQRNRLSSSRFEKVLEQLQKADTDIKTGRQTQRIALELLMTRLLDLI